MLAGHISLSAPSEYHMVLPQAFSSSYSMSRTHPSRLSARIIHLLITQRLHFLGLGDWGIGWACSTPWILIEPLHLCCFRWLPGWLQVCAIVVHNNVGQLPWTFFNDFLATCVGVSFSTISIAVTIFASFPLGRCLLCTLIVLVFLYRFA